MNAGTMEKPDDRENIINVNIYDTHAANGNFKVLQRTTAADISRIILSKRDMLTSESRFFSLVLVVTAANPAKKADTHCLRTLKANEALLEVQASIVLRLSQRLHKDVCKTASARWFFKDMRTNPIELGASADVTGEYSSDEDEEISQSDLSYLAKSERKGYLLKRSNTDFNLWRRWYCVLMDQMWCVDITRENPRAKGVKLSGMIRYREGYKTLDQLQIIIINSPDGRSHFFRAFNLIDQKKWIQDLNLKTIMAADCNCFSMAEMIINDEEGAKNLRVVRRVGELLDLPKTMQAVAFHKAVELSDSEGGTPATPNPATPTPEEQQEQQKQGHERGQGEDRGIESAETSTETDVAVDSANGMPSTEIQSEQSGGAGAEAPTPPPKLSPLAFPGTRTRSLSRSRPSLSRDSANTSNLTSADGTTSNGMATMSAADAENLTFERCLNLSHPRPCSALDLSRVNVYRRLDQHHLVHELYRDARVVSDVMAFCVDVQGYKELLRHDVSCSVRRQQQAACRVYGRHIVPQLLLSDVELTDLADQIAQLCGDSSSSGAGAGAGTGGAGAGVGAGGAGTGGAGEGGSAASQAERRNEFASRVRRLSLTAPTPASSSSTNPAQPYKVRNATNAGSGGGMGVVESLTQAQYWGVDPALLLAIHDSLWSHAQPSDSPAQDKHARTPPSPQALPQSAWSWLPFTAPAPAPAPSGHSAHSPGPRGLSSSPRARGREEEQARAPPADVFDAVMRELMRKLS
ncbi:hypothetical protein B484DRAFT_401765 [Ochromonadaceae sp. CCMP2298]|nr:hypothetical protein B484DRAFT_401765 [Ochromonadaceae sp. CCMP2298]